MITNRKETDPAVYENDIISSWDIRRIYKWKDWKRKALNDKREIMGKRKYAETMRLAQDKIMWTAAVPPKIFLLNHQKGFVFSSKVLWRIVIYLSLISHIYL